MSGQLRDYEFRERYETSSASLVEDFYVPALDRATTYDRAVGYFRSSVFHLTQVAMSDFALRGGRMRLICSPHLDENDAKVMQRAFGQAEELIVASIGHDIEKALQDVAEHASLQMLATLLEFGILEIRLTYKPKQTGIFHTKIGIISDGTDSLSFDGSANETFMAWSENEERVTPFCSWRDDYQHRQVQWDTDYFEDLWESKKAGLKTQALPEVVFEDLRQYAVPDPQEAIEQVRLAQLGQSQRSSTASKGTRKTPMRHQAQVRDNWLKEMRGIICFVTGGGKTVAALEIINEWIIRHPKGSVIVLVPSNLLAKQWRKELAQLDSYLNILQVGGDDAHANWRERLSDYTRETPAATRPRVVLAVMKSAASADFLRLAQVGDHTLLVADEVHTVGAKQLRMALTLETGGRLGLSATPERFGDEEGTAVIFDYFGDKLEPEYTIRDAQQGENPRLVPYVYEPDVLFLTPSEYDKYEKESQLIKRLAGQAASSGSAGDEEKLQIARIRRARILKTASAKPSLAVKVIQEEFRDGDRWLVYCDDGRQLEEVKRLLKEALIDSGVMPLEYTSAMIFDPDATITHFEKRGGVLLAIRCLDEGVDIPSITHALILASSTNPREHLQRRGRVLRVATNKAKATIHDFLVSPNEAQPTVVFDHDLERSIAFAEDASNSRRANRWLSSLSAFSTMDSNPWEEEETGRVDD